MIAPGETGTRSRLLAAAFEEFFRRGFQAGSVDAIVARAGVTKGALYHHFPDKVALGYAVLDEVVRAPLLAAYLAPLEEIEGDPLSALQEVLRRRADDFIAGGIELGCPLNNLAQEMSPLDEGFRTRAAATLDEWTRAFAHVLDRAKEYGSVRTDVDTLRVAGLIVAAVEGSFGMAKAEQSVAALRSNLDALAELLEGLRPVD
jgi:AcrR family transcriptional regulator